MSIGERLERIERRATFAMATIAAGCFEWFAVGWFASSLAAEDPAPLWPAGAAAATAAVILVGYAAWRRRIDWRDVAMIVTAVATVGAAIR